MAHRPEATTELKDLLGKEVVIDTDSSYVYVGTLEKVSDEYLCITHVDVHDTKDSSSSKEQYAHETRKLGIRSNRKMTLLRLERVLSISKLEDVIIF